MAIERAAPEEAGGPAIEAEYKYEDVKWKDFVTKPKYIRKSIPIFVRDEFKALD